MGKKRKIKPKRKDEFRRLNNKTSKGHPTYVYTQIGNKYKFFGLTSSRKTDGIKNEELEKNPEPRNMDSSYIKPYSEIGHRKEFSAPLIGWKFTDNDKKKVKSFIDSNTSKKDIKDKQKKKGRRPEN